MKIRILFGAAAVSASLCCGCATTPAPKTAASPLLAIPQTAADREYLGLPEAATSFRFEDIRCELLVVDCFDMYCHICQAGAKHVNELYSLVQGRGWGQRVKFVGLGVGDTPLEVATYKDKFKVPFPLFPDRRSVLVKQFGELRLPNLLVLRNRQGQLEVIHRSPGALLNPKALLPPIEAELGQLHSGFPSDPAQAAQPTCEAGRPCPNPGLLPAADSCPVFDAR